MICNEVQQDLALAAAGTLDSARLLAVTQHCRQCPQCAARLEELQSVTSAHSKVVEELNRLPFHYRRSAAAPTHRLESLSRKTTQRSVLRWLVPVGATVVLAVSLLQLYRGSSPHIPQNRAPVPAKTAAVVAGQSPSLAAYRNALNEAGDASLDALLARHEKHLLPGTPEPELRRMREQL